MKAYQVREQLHDELIPHLLLSRGVPLEQHEAFLYPDYERDSHDPLLLPDMERAVERILRALAEGESAAVWSDYDCDGVPGGVMLTDFLRRIGLSVRHYIPHRHKEGYGMNEGGIDELAEAGVTLIITIDLGTTEHEPISYAKKKGIDVIVTDHHLVHSEPAGELASEKVLGSPRPSSDGLRPDHFLQQTLPPAFAVINPKRLDSRYPFDGLCGAGVAWKLLQAILEKRRDLLPPGVEKWYLDLVGLATLSDMVPLVGENRMLARFGLMVLRKNRRPGLAQLLSLLRIKPAGLTEDDVGFMLSPRINAASRMDSPELAAKLLATKDWQEARSLAERLDAINTERKTLVASTVKEVNKRIADHEGMPLIAMGNPKWRPGILGLVANSLMQSHGVPVFLWGREGGELLRGSCRSDGRVSVVELMQGAREVFDHFGGHTASGGFALTLARAHELGPKLTEVYQSLARSEVVEELPLDRQLDVAEIARAHRELGAIAPFGVGNTKPLFLFPNVRVASLRRFGKAKDHLGLSLERDGSAIAGVSFFSTPQSYQKQVAAGDRADVVAHIETDWRGGPRLRVVDII